MCDVCTRVCVRARAFVCRVPGVILCRSVQWLR